MTESLLPADLANELDVFFQNSADLMAVLDEELRVVLCNPAFAREAPLPRGASISQLCDEHEGARVTEWLRGCLAGKPGSFKARINTASGPRSCEWLVSAQAARARLFVSLRDITNAERLERELAQSQKLEAIGSLASGIAHEINTPIQFVGDNLTFISDALRDVFILLGELEQHETAQQLRSRYPKIDLPFLTEELPAAVEQACEGVQRVAELVRGLKEFSHQDGGQVTPTDLNQALQRTIAIARNEWKYVAELETDLQPLPLVPCQASAMRQVFLNLICNAAHANQERNTRSGRPRGLIRVTTRREGDSVRIAIADTGTGIPENVRARLFEPFFTTKPVGKGTGQGLAISRAIVCEKHAGRLEYETTVGEGTTFIVTLPLSPVSQVTAP